MAESKTTLVQELRLKLESAIEGLDKDEYYQTDLDRARTDDKWMLRFLQHNEFDVTQALNMAVNCLKWRKEFGVYSISENTLPRDMIKAGAIYPATYDKEGHQILMFHVRMHQKDAAQMENKKKLMVYWVEKMEKDNDGQKIIVLFDMTETGIANSDLEIVKFFISLFKYYYPNLLAYLLVYEMPWILSAAWKIVKTWLNARAVDKIRFITRATIQDYVAAEELPSNMGGSSTFQYYPPTDGSESASSDSEPSGSLLTPRKKVHFANDGGQSDEITEESPEPVQNNHKKVSDDGYFNGRLLRISPAEELVFLSEGNADNFGILYLTNNTAHSVAFKVKTTSPEKFRVRPSSGVIKPMCKADVVVQLQFAYQNSPLFRDKFLILGMELETDEITGQDLSNLWRLCLRENIMEHKLRCSLSKTAGNAKNEFAEPSKSSICNNPICNHTVKEIESLKKKMEDLRQTATVFGTFFVLIYLLLLLIVCSLWFRVESLATGEPVIGRGVCELPPS